MENNKQCDGSGTIINGSMHPILGPQFYPKKCKGCKNCQKDKTLPITNKLARNDK